MASSKYVDGIKPGDSNVVSGYHIDEFTQPGQQSILSLNHTLTHFPLESGCVDYSFWTKQLHTSSMVLIPSSVTPLNTATGCIL